MAPPWARTCGKAREGVRRPTQRSCTVPLLSAKLRKPVSGTLVMICFRIAPNVPPFRDAESLALLRRHRHERDGAQIRGVHRAQGIRLADARRPRADTSGEEAGRQPRTLRGRCGRLWSIRGMGATSAHRRDNTSRGDTMVARADGALDASRPPWLGHRFRQGSVSAPPPDKRLRRAIRHVAASPG